MAAPPAKRGGASSSGNPTLRPLWVLQSIHTAGLGQPPQHRDRIARAALRVRKQWKELEDEVFRPLVTAEEKAVIEPGWSMPPGTVCWLVLKSAFCWFADLASSPVQSRRDIESELHDANDAVRGAAAAFLAALTRHKAAHAAATSSGVAVPDGYWNDDLVAALQTAANLFPRWSIVAGEEHGGALQRLLRLTAETSQPTPGVSDLIRAACVLPSNVPIRPSYGGSKSHAGSTLAVPFMEALDRIGCNCGYPDTGPLKWLNEVRLATLLQTVRGDDLPNSKEASEGPARESLPSVEMVRRARNQVLSLRAG